MVIVSGPDVSNGTVLSVLFLFSIFVNSWESSFLKKDFISLLLERREGREEERERNTDRLSHSCPDWNQTHNPGMCLENRTNYPLRDVAQPTEPHRFQEGEVL